MGGGSIPDPNVAAMQGLKEQINQYPYSYIVNALSQMGGKQTLLSPSGKMSTVDFTGLGTADVQNKFQNQMAQVFLDIQNGMGADFIAQKLANLKQSDPTGYAAYQQLFDKIQEDAAAQPPNMPLSESTQKQVQDILNQGQALTPKELQQVQEQVRGNQVSKGLYLGGAETQEEAGAALAATDTKQQQAQQEAQSFLQASISPSDIQYRKIQQDMANLGAFINKQDPVAQFSSLSGAQQGAAPYVSTGYSTPTMNQAQGAQQGINQAFGLYGANQQQANPYMAGLSLGATSLGLIGQSGYFKQSPYQYQSGYQAPTPYSPSPTMSAPPPIPYAGTNFIGNIQAGGLGF